jgi:hypothetical protein
MIMTEDEVADKIYVLSCPLCEEEILQDDQIRCTNCKVLFDWEDEE